MTTLKTWHSDPDLKARTMARAATHIAADLLRHGETGNVIGGERGCSVSCTVGTYDHGRYPDELGLPVWLAQLQDRIYESLPVDERGLDINWTLDFLGAVPVGIDADRALAPILVRILTEIALPAVTVDYGGVRAAILQVIDALRGHGDLEAARVAIQVAWGAAGGAAWIAARAAAGVAARAAAGGAAGGAAGVAARAAARAAGWAATRAAAGGAAEAAAKVVLWAAEAAETAAWIAAWTAAWEAAETAAWEAAGAAAWEAIREIMLTELHALGKEGI